MVKPDEAAFGTLRERRSALSALCVAAPIGGVETALAIGWLRLAVGIVRIVGQPEAP